MGNKINSKHDIESPAYALRCVRSILISSGENNWIRGINHALTEIENQYDSKNSKSIIKTMMQNGRGFTEYYVATGTVDFCKEVNRQLELLKDYLWEWAAK